MDDQSPRRKHQLICKVEGDTLIGLANELRLAATALERGELGRFGCRGGNTSGTMYSHSSDPSITHRSYYQALDKYLEDQSSVFDTPSAPGASDSDPRGSE